MLISKDKLLKKEPNVSVKYKYEGIDLAYSTTAYCLQTLSEEYLHLLKDLQEKIDYYAGHDYIYNYLKDIRSSATQCDEVYLANHYVDIEAATTKIFSFKDWTNDAINCLTILARACATLKQALDFIEYINQNNLCLRSK